MLENIMNKRNQPAPGADKPAPDLDAIMGASHEEPDGDEGMMDGDPVKSALEGAGYVVTEDKLQQIKSILGEPGGASPQPEVEMPAGL